MAVDNRADEIDEHTVSLCALPTGQSARIVHIDAHDNHRLMKLAALGMVPGSTVYLQQRVPAYVVRVGETMLTFDSAVARDILVQVT